MDRAAIFIDGGYFAKVLKDLGAPKIDFLKLSDELCRQTDAERFRTYYYYCMPYQSSPPTDEEKARFIRTERFMTYLKRLPRFEVRLGKLGKRHHICPNCKNQTIEYEQKRVDNLLTVDLVSLSRQNVIQKAILITGDSDFVPAVDEASRAGVITRVYYAWTQNCTIHDELYEKCDERVKIDEKLIDSVTIQPLNLQR